jgi:ABC-2 type transport system permease protein
MSATLGLRTLFRKEILRFWKVAFQTVAAPVLTAVMYLLIFGHVLEGRCRPSRRGLHQLPAAGAGDDERAAERLRQQQQPDPEQGHRQPGVPAGHAAVARLVSGLRRRGRGARLAVGLGVGLVALWFVPWQGLQPASLPWALAFGLLGAALMGALGLIAGLWADKFDQLAAFQNFLVMPMTMLAGVFYSVDGLPPFWKAASHLNPFFFMVDGFRHGFFGVSDTPPWLSLGIVAVALAGVSALTIRLLASGYKIRH